MWTEMGERRKSKMVVAVGDGADDALRYTLHTCILYEQQHDIINSKSSRITV